MLKNERLDQRQWIMLFIVGVTLCAVFFAFGLFIGKQSAGQPMSTVAAQSQDSTAATGSQQATSGDVTDRSAPPLEDNPANSTSAQEGGTDLSSPQQAAPPVGVEGEAKSAEGPPATSSAQGLATGGSAREQTPDEQRRFYVRAGTFTTSQEAQNFAATLSNRGWGSAFTREETSEDGQRRFLVLLGPYVDRDSAVLRMNMLRNEGVSSVSVFSQP